MWGNFGDLTKKLAEKAAAAAENIEGQLNESVGATPEVLNELSKNRVSQSGSMEVMEPTPEQAVSDDDLFDEDDDFYQDDSFDVDMHDDEPKIENDETTNVVTEEPVLATENEATTEVNSEDINSSDKEIGVEPEQQQLGTEQQPQEAVAAEKIDSFDEEFEAEPEQDGDNIQEEGLYDDEEDDDEEIDFVQEEDPVQEIPAQDEPSEITVEEHLTQAKEEEEAGFFDQQEQDNEEPQEQQIISNMNEEKTESGPSLQFGAVSNILSAAAEKLQTHVSNEMVVEEQNEQDAVIADEESSIPVDHNKVEEPDHIQNAPLDDNEGLSDGDDEESVYVSKEELHSSFNEASNIEKEKLEIQVKELQTQLSKQIRDLQEKVNQREQQLASKSNQIAEMMAIHEKEKAALEIKVRETKDEAKKRINKAKEKVDEYKKQLMDANSRAASAGNNSSEQEEIITALRQEGEKLAMKQSSMEQSVREAKADIRDLKKELEKEKEDNHVANDKITSLSNELNDTKAALKAAQEKGGLADKLDSDLLEAREEREKKASLIITLEANLKEAKARNIELKKEMEQALKDQLAELEYETKSIRNEKDSILQDLETKLRTSEREANLREDSLRHEVAELRKRWQEAVRRCDALSIDLQQSSAPLLRQLESTERQNRARASAWTELETKLRKEIEEIMIEKDGLKNEKNELEAEIKKTRRTLQGKESELLVSTSRVEELTKQVEEITSSYENAVSELEILKVDFKNLEETITDNESKARSEVLKTLRENEEQFNDHIESLEVELRQEKDKRVSLEQEIQKMMESAEVAMAQTGNKVQTAKSPKRSLSGKVDQVDILQSTLLGLGTDDYVEDNKEDDDQDDGADEIPTASHQSFAFIEQLSQNLKATKLERDTLRKQLHDSEERRSVLENEAALNKEAIKELQSHKSQVEKLQVQVQQKDLEIQALQDDIVDVRAMYKSQLNALMGIEENQGNEVQHNPSAQSKPETKVTKTPEPKRQEKVVIPTSFTGMRSF